MSVRRAKHSGIPGAWRNERGREAERQRERQRERGRTGQDRRGEDRT